MPADKKITLILFFNIAEAYNELGPPVSFMTGSYDNNSSPHHMQQPPQDPYNVPPYGNYVQPPLGSDSGSGSGYVPMPPGGFSPTVTSASKDFMDPIQVSQMHGNSSGASAASMMHEPWNNNEHRLETTYDCY